MWSEDEAIERGSQRLGEGLWYRVYRLEES